MHYKTYVKPYFDIESLSFIYVIKSTIKRLSAFEVF